VSETQDFNIEDFLGEEPVEQGLVPEGAQLFSVISKPVVGETQNGGKYLRVTVKALEHPACELVSVFFTVIGNEKAVQIGKEQFGQLARACGATSGDAGKLVGARFVAKVKHKPNYRDPSKIEASLAFFKPAPPLGQQVGAAAPKAAAPRWAKPIKDEED